MRARSMTLLDIARELGVSKSSVSVWVRDVEFVPSKRRTGPRHRPHPQQLEKLAQIETCNEWGRQKFLKLSDDVFFAVGVALYAGEGSKTDGEVKFANTNAAMMKFFSRWLREFFPIDESRLRGRLYLHEGLDLEAANDHWSDIVRIPVSQFGKPYRAAPNHSIRDSKHEFGCFTLCYASSLVHRKIMGSVNALLS